MKTKNILLPLLTLSLFFHFSPALCSEQEEILADGVYTTFTPQLTTPIAASIDNNGHLYIEPERTSFLQGQVLVDLTNLPADALSFQAPAYTPRPYTPRKRKARSKPPASERQARPNKKASAQPDKETVDLPPKDSAQPNPASLSESNKENIENRSLNCPLPLNVLPLHLLLGRPEQPHLSGTFTPISRHRMATSYRLQPSYIAPDFSGGQYPGGIPLGYSPSSTEEFKVRVENYYQLTHKAEAKNYLDAFEAAKEDYSLPLTYRSQAACYIEEIYIFMQQHDARAFNNLDKLSRAHRIHPSVLHMANFLKAFLRCMNRTLEITDSQAVVYLNTVIESGNLPDKYTLAAKFLRGMLHCLERQEMSSDTAAMFELERFFDNEATSFSNIFLQQLDPKKVNYMRLWFNFYHSLQNQRQESGITINVPHINVNKRDTKFLIEFHQQGNLDLNLKIAAAKLAGLYLEHQVKESTRKSIL
ncbi:hypothetical protein [Candidatus Odyssella thessalonicensis]|uniref:hypothetical protein n=1 Tax=Candidatus Odyssella thessalonicensis TaxID=84647 RepID=UPI000225BDB6|nr:hypothetical protein [Candidatus Odyssella thessalonicensis]